MRNLDTFKRITNYDIAVYFYDFGNFIQTYLGSIDTYYQGQQVNKEAFVKLSTLLTTANTIQEIISLNKEQLSGDTSFWDLLDDFEETKTKLETINNWGKWSRSSYLFGYDSKTKNQYSLKQNQNIESASEFTGSQNPQDDWATVAVENQLKEIDYSKEGGNEIYVGGSLDGNGDFTNNGVVDFMVGDRVLGVDLPKKMSFNSDDVLKLDTKQTLEQASQIFCSLTKKSVPEFPNMGYFKDIAGNSLFYVLLSPLKRQILESFATDRSIKSVEFTSITKEQDSLFYELKIISKLNHEINITI